jgi:hypothetical protein
MRQRPIFDKPQGFPIVWSAYAAHDCCAELQYPILQVESCDDDSQSESSVELLAATQAPDVESHVSRPLQNSPSLQSAAVHACALLTAKKTDKIKNTTYKKRIA